MTQMTTQTFTEVAERHAAQDMLRKGIYGKMNGQFRGCSIGCFLYDYEPDVATDHVNVHARLAKHTGIAKWALYVQDYLFESLPNPAEWHVECAKAYDAFSGDWDQAAHRFMARVQREVVANPTEHNERVAALHDRAASGDMPDADEWSAAESAAESAAGSAAESAVWLAAWLAAGSAVWLAVKDIFLAVLDEPKPLHE